MIPIILLSARAGEESRVEGLEAGADDYLVKPFSARELRARVSAHFTLSRARQTAIKLEAMLHERERFYAFAEHSLDFIGIAALDGQMLYVNPSGRALVGLTGVEEVSARKLTDLFPDEQRTASEETLRQVLSTGHWEGEVVWQHLQNGQRKEMWQSLFTITDSASGRPAYVAMIARDMTERQQAEREIRHLLTITEQRNEELRTKQDQLVQAEKLATVGELATGVAHELNNPLNNIGLIVGNLLDRLHAGAVEPSTLLTNLELTLAQVHKAATIVTHLRSFGRVATTDYEPVSINEIVAASASLMKEQLRLRNIQLILDLGSPIPAIVGNAIQLEQVIVNLLTNARDALAAAATKQIHISTAFDGDRVTLTIRDTGIGIPVEMQRRIFDPFFTTKPIGQGTGLGLSISYSIIQEHHGSIVVDSRPQEGTAFRIELPVAANR